jgi:hypothetical protein
MPRFQLPVTPPRVAERDEELFRPFPFGYSGQDVTGGRYHDFVIDPDAGLQVIHGCVQDKTVLGADGAAFKNRHRRNLRILAFKVQLEQQFTECQAGATVDRNPDRTLFVMLAQQGNRT